MRDPGRAPSPSAGLIRGFESTELFVPGAHGPRQVVRVRLDADRLRDRLHRGDHVQVRVEGPAVSTPEPVVLTARSGPTVPSEPTAPTGSPEQARRAESAETVVEVPVVLAAPVTEGARRRVTAIADVAPADPSSAPVRQVREGELIAAVPGWTMWMVSHFHYDPVWWNSQSGFTQAWADLPVAEAKRPAICRSAFDLLRAHLDAAEQDPDYRFVLAELDYLKPHTDVHPGDRARLRRLLAEGRLELVGGTYNEPNTNLTHPESTVRNLVYGIGYQRDVLGGDPRTAWQLDVFGHDPAFPGLVAQAGLDSSAWARGPFHMVGTKRHTGDITRMQLPSEFEWISPSGRGVLTHYMADHYVAGWQFEVQPTLEAALADAYREFGELRQVAATRNVLLPVGHDHNVPSRWCTEIHRAWPQRYLWPRFRLGLPRDFFDAVRAETGARMPGQAPARTSGRRLSPQTRDMNPVFTGKDVSYIDTKQAQRAGEVAVLEAERFATLAWLLGRQAPEHEVEYPALALDKAWRQLLYGAHHDAITGTESDQVYLDLLGGWREAFELGDQVRAAALDQLAVHADTTGSGQAVLVANGLSWPRDGAFAVELSFAEPGTAGVALQDDAGRPVPAVTESVTRHPDGTLAAATLTALARDVPALGYRIYRAVPADRLPEGWQATDPAADRDRGPTDGDAGPSGSGAAGTPTIRNDALLLSADPARGGALCRVLDRRHDRELLRPGGLAAEAYLQSEHPKHPVWEEGPWHLLPIGPGRGAREVRAQVRVETSAIGSRLVSVAHLDELRLTQEVTLWHGAEHAELVLHVDGSIGSDRLLRSRFELDLPGALPVAEVGFGVVGRSVGFVDVDTVEQQWTLDSPALTWAGLSATACIALHRPDGSRARHAIGVAEVVAPDGGVADQGHDAVRELLVRLAGQGVTATCTRPDGERHGALDADSNLPDVRIVLGTEHTVARGILDILEPAERAAALAALVAHGRVFLPAPVSRQQRWLPGADLRGPRDLPVLMIGGPDIGAAITALADDLDDATIDVPLPDALPGTSEPFEGYSVAVANTGTPGFVVDPAGTLHLNLMRSCSGWPCGVWIEGEPRTAPDGSSFAWQHWSHTFGFRLVAGAGDWREAGFVRAGHEANHPLAARVVACAPGPLPPALSLARVEPASVALTALKPRGNPIASGRPAQPNAHPPSDPLVSAEAARHPGITVRLYESSGRPTAARVQVYGTQDNPVSCDLLENRLPDATVPPGLVQLAPAEVVTAALTAAPRVEPSAARPGTRPAVPLGPSSEPVQPVHSRYWLHNLGAAPIGYLPVTVHVRPGRLALSPDDGNPDGELVVTVSASTRPAAGILHLLTPPGLTLHGPGSVSYRLAAGEDLIHPVRVRAVAARPGRYVVAARIEDDLGQLIEDTVEVTVGADAQPATDGQRLVAVEFGPSRLVLPPGGSGELTASVRGLAGSAVQGQVLLLSPHGSWGAGVREPLIGPSVQGFSVQPGERAPVRFTVRVPPAARPGTELWALAKVTCAGRVQYSPTVSVAVRTP